MRAIMISGKPKWSAKIANGDKTVEVRTSKSLYKAIQTLIDENGYADIYWYCSKGDVLEYFYDTNDNFGEYITHKGKCWEDEQLNGKVIFKFRCYKVEEIRPKVKLGLLNTYNTYETKTLVINPLLEKCCLSYEELDLYLKWKVGYAIYISNLEIFDEPKELSEFKPFNNGMPQYRFTKNGCEIKPLIKAPQNFCYVEVE